jgi:hypothetical protein
MSVKSASKGHSLSVTEYLLIPVEQLLKLPLI